MATEKSGLDAVLEQEEALFPLPVDDNEPIPPPSPSPVGDVPAAEPTPAPATPEPVTPPPAAPEPAPLPPTPVPPVPPVEAAAHEADGAPWKAKREAERREKDALTELNAAREREQSLLREIEAARRPAPAIPQSPTQEQLLDDPLLAVEDRLTRTEQALQAQAERNAQLEQSVQRQTRDTTLAREADSFTREHPDFPAARDFYIQKQIDEAELTGELDAVAADLRQRVPGQIATAARERGVTEAAIAHDLATAVLFENRLAMMERTAAARGKSVVATVYELAQSRGFGGTAPVAIPSNGAPAPVAVNPALSAADGLRREQATAAASSLAAMPSSPTAPVMGGSLTYTSFLSMDTGAQSRLIDQLDNAARYGLVPENWTEELQAGRPVAVPDSAQVQARMREGSPGVNF